MLCSLAICCEPLVYLPDFAAAAATLVLVRHHAHSVVDDWPIRRSKHHALYLAEQAVEYRPGTALLYRMDTFHRGTPVRPGGARRLTNHCVIKRATAEWMGSNSFNAPGQYLPTAVASLHLCLP